MVGQILLPLLLAFITATAYLSFAWTRWGRIGTTVAVGLFSVAVFTLLVGWIVRDDLPTRGEAATLYLPAVFVLIGIGQALDRLFGRDKPRSTPAFETRSAVIALTILTLCSSVGLVFVAAEPDYSGRPDDVVLLPLPDDLTLVAHDEDCGSELCSETFEISAPDRPGVAAVEHRLQLHLTESKGWRFDPVRPGHACRHLGWFTDRPTCVTIGSGAEPGSVAVVLSSLS
ncbi:hypothetical protein AB0M47_40465 [Hamadaea sp. NPDC051192]|uniref:hypothetical protein n=1 Tax=Hamadaea sp. NPDC051192 TaxID=3154940 RepID=UPI003414E34D